ncbi:MAG: DUF3106 domain-containing protein [Pseudomonadota bacterium]
MTVPATAPANAASRLRSAFTSAGPSLDSRAMLVCVILTTGAIAAYGQTATGSQTGANAAVTSRTGAPASAKTASSASRPLWTELTAKQQETLKPLAGSWNAISEQQKRKWLEISKNYHSLPPGGQATMHSRMNEWVALSPQQRAEARLNFAKTKELSRQLTSEEKKAKWQTYQALSPEEKQKLAAKAPVRPTGAATAVKPVAPQKLAAVPLAGTPKIAASRAVQAQLPAKAKTALPAAAQ